MVLRIVDGLNFHRGILIGRLSRDGSCGDGIHLPRLIGSGEIAVDNGTNGSGEVSSGITRLSPFGLGPNGSLSRACMVAEGGVLGSVTETRKLIGRLV